MPPLKIVLAGLVFSRTLDGAAPRLADALTNQFEPDELDRLCGEIRAALEDATSDLATKLDLPHSEVDIRAFLTRLAKRLEA
jgi:hypothetical protein